MMIAVVVCTLGNNDSSSNSSRNIVAVILTVDGRLVFCFSS